MELKMYKAAWGMPGGWEKRIKQISEAGYTGIETPMPSRADETLFRELLDQYHLDLILQIYTGCEHNEKPYPDTAKEHTISLETQMERAVTFKPVMINSQSAKDSMPYDEQLAFYEQSIRIEQQAGIPIAHETHRGRAMFTPWSTARLLRDLPDLHIAADFSHWCCVCESLLPDHAESLSLAAKHAIHIHGRVGYEQGPQVPDFRAPEYEYALVQFERWWDEICEAHRSKGRPSVHFTPEFGPPGYMHTQLYTKQPVVDLWEICYAMGQRFRDRFTRKFI
ncbi:sugar phosphate isomerase/epimerase family protein [Paenibacillus tarimensis]